MKISLFIITSGLLACQALPSHSSFRYFTTSRIVGGQPINIEDVPYQVSLQFTYIHLCGGSIISKRWILSAGHCFFLMNSSLWKIRVGSSFKELGGELYNVSRIIRHPEYNDNILDYDYALIELSKELKFSTTVQAISLPEKYDEIEAGTECLVSGWGDTGNPYQEVEYLRAVVVPIVDHEKCKEQYEVLNETVSTRMICAGYDKGGKDACKGDSGGPLVCNKTLVGVVSWGIECAMPRKPGVYSNVVYVRDWIKQVSNV